MTSVKISSPFSGTRGHALQKDFFSVERPSPEGAGSSSCDSHSAPWTGTLSSPLTHSLLRSKRSKETLNGCPEYNSTKSIGRTTEIFDTGHLCKKCISYFNVFKREALKQVIEGNVSPRDPKSSIHLYESMKTPASALEAWSNVDGRCGVCSTHLSQLKQEAIRTILTQDRAIWATPFTANTSYASLNSGSQTLPGTRSHCSAMSNPHQRPRNVAPDCWIRGRQHLEALLPLSSSNGINSASLKTSQNPSHVENEVEKERMSSTALCHYSTPQPSRASSMSSLLPAGTSAALGFIVRAVQKLNVMVRRRRPWSESGGSQHPTNFSSLLQKSPPPAPANLLQAASKSKETPGMGKVKVMLRICSGPVPDVAQCHSFKLDLRKKQITVVNQATQNPLRQAASAAVSQKTFSFDAAFGYDSTQAEVCESSLCELLQSVIAGADGCILSFGQTKVGMSYTMIGHDGCIQNLGVIPCAISWLFKLINRKKDKTWANISVSVSAVEVCGENNVIRDLLSGVDTGNCKDTYKPDVYLTEDPIYGIQLCNQSVLNAPTPERAAFFLDAAIASRSSDMMNTGGTPSHCCHMFFTLHVHQQHIGSSTKSGMNVDQSKLSLIDLGSCMGERNNCGICLADLGNVIIAKLNRHKHFPNKGNKLAMLLQDSLSNVNCSTTIIAHISTLAEDLTENLCTMQTASRIRRLQKKTRKSSSSSPGVRSSGNEKKNNNSTRLRTFQSTGTLDQDLSSPSFFSDPEYYPGSNKSCDTVISVNPSGHALLNKEVTNRSREFVPIIPSLLKSKLESKKLSLMKFCEISPPIACRIKQIPKEKTKEESTPTILADRLESDFECLKCNTFAELQNRLGNIDGTELDSMDPCREQPVIKAPLSGLADKKSIPSGGQASVKRESDSIRQDNSPKREAVNHNGKETLSNVNSQNIQLCSPRLDIVRKSDPIQSVQSPSRSKCQTEIMDVMPASLSLTLEDRNILSDDSTMHPETRISPVGKSSPRSTSSSSFSSSLSASSSSPLTVSASVNEVIPQCTLKNQREMKATITVTVQQPLDLNGHDELVYTVVEEVTINGATDKGKAKILSVHDSPSLQALTPGCQPVRIIGSVGDEQTEIISSCNAQTSETDMSMALTDAAVNENAPVQHSNINTQTEKVSTNTDIKDLQNTWSEVLLTEDVKDITKGVKVIPDPSCIHSNNSKSRLYSCEISKGQSLLCLNKNNYFKDAPFPHVNTEHKNSNSPRETLERKQYTMKQELVEWTKDNVPLPTYKSSPTQRRRVKEESGIAKSLFLSQRQPLVTETNPKSLGEGSSKLFDAKLKALASRSQTLDHSNSGTSLSSTGSLEGNCTSPRINRRLLEESSCIDVGPEVFFKGDYMAAYSNSVNSPEFKEEIEDDFISCRAKQSLGRVPRFFPMHDTGASDTTRPSKTNKSKTSANKLLPSSKSHKMSGTSSKTSSLSPKSVRHSINRSSSFSPKGSTINQSSWSTQSLTRSQVKGGLSSRSSGLVLKGRVGLLRSSRDSLSSFSQGGSDIDESEELKEKETKPFIQTLPSPYSQITAPRKPYHCSGHASDNTSVLSGELPPAMCKTALLYNRSSMVSSGYESILRDSEATISSSSTHNSISDQSCSLGAAKGARSTKKRTNIGSGPRCQSQDTLLSLKKSLSGPKMHWVDRSVSDSYEIKVYEIDNVDALQKRGGAGNKCVVRFSAKLKFLEHRQQRIAEVRARYNALKRELEHAKEHLMVDPGKWTREFDLWQTFEVDSLEHLEALELVTERLERQVNLCKAHVLMVTCFDVTPKRKQKLRHRPSVDHKGFVGI